MNTLEAVKALKNGEEYAFKFLFDKYYNRLVAYITTYTHDKMSAEDIVQQAFIDLWNNKKKINENKPLKSYLYAIAYNRFIDTVNKDKRQNIVLGQIYELALRDIIDEDNEALEKRILKMNQIIKTLPPKCRQTLEMNKIKGYKYHEIAEIMGVSIKTVESQMSVAFKKIRKGFDKENLHLLFINFYKKINIRQTKNSNLSF
ncbi:RNA polymerase sigma-70 factor [Formosa sediminum]|uniref:RNA polymerase sigma-70 factor n=1 Tax=Formosa sediminum TaxID=2594004 RepID=A0A516GVG0_9FLAO|nr:RNA polymerase sigma-70 factor [Formosa sediminum]QDO95502.1 RNA polymerase sigma-70 factor [Formosa sediminum]